MPASVLAHLIFMAVMLLMCLLAAFVAKRRAEGWLTKHRIIAALGVCSGITGFAIMVYEKIEHGYPHFKSTHSLLGLSCCILLLLVPVGGYLASTGKNALRMPHRIFARIMIILGISAATTGVFRYLQISKPK